MTDINFTKYVTTPKGKRVKGVMMNEYGVPYTDSMGTVIEVGVAESITASPPIQFFNITDPVALTTEQLLDLGILGRKERKGNEERSPGQEKERKIQLYGIDIIVFPRAFYEWLLTEDGRGMFTYERMKKHCATVQVKYQPFAHQYKTINFEKLNRHYKFKDNYDAYDDHITAHNADFTAYVVTSKVVILAATERYKELASKVEAKPIGKPHYYRGKDAKYHRRQTFTHRLNIHTLLSDSATSVLGLSELFEEYHLKAREAEEPCEGWESNSIHHWYYSQNWSLNTYKDYLAIGPRSLFEQEDEDHYGLKDGIYLQGGIH